MAKLNYGKNHSYVDIGEKNMAKAMVYIQSGGPTAVINTSLYGAIKEAELHPEEISAIYGSRYGIEGLIYDDLIDLNKEEDEQIELLKQTPGAILGSTRYKLPKDFHDPQYLKILSTLEKHNIGYVFVNGGNDSMDTCHKLSMLFNETKADVKVIGVPKTIDNDLTNTDHSLGYGSAAKYVINTMKEICVDASCYKKGKVFIVEIMGRNAGWLTASVDVLPEEYRPDLIYLPENKFDLDQFIIDMTAIYKMKGHAVVAISEGIIFERDTSCSRIDSFGHMQLGGCADALAQIVEKRTNFPTRSIELSLIQRADPILASKVDQEEALFCGKFAVKKALEGETGKMVTIKRVSSRPYKVAYSTANIHEIANEERKFPPSMMSGVTKMSPEFKEYCEPLIQGNVEIKYDNGIFLTSRLKNIKVE